VVWNTRYTGLALDELRAGGMRTDREDMERLSPPLHHHIRLDGHYQFTLPEPLARRRIPVAARSERSRRALPNR
jgi:hypothetical protein